MTASDEDLAGRAAALRRAFDRSFAEPPAGAPAALEDLLAVRVAGDPFALRLRDVAGLFADKVITPLPSPLPELVGVAGFRGEIVPVYDLRLLLGYAPGQAARWLVLVSTGRAQVALAFEHFEGHLRVGLDAIVGEAPRTGRSHVREVLRVGDATRPVVDVAAMLEGMTTRAQQRPGPEPQGIPQRER